MVPTDRPFTLHSSGCSRAVLRRLELSGQVRRVLRGVYAHADLELDPDVRQRALDLVLPEGAVPVGVTAAWAHGLLATCPRVESGRRAPLSLLEATVVVGPAEGLPVYDAALRQGLSHLRLLDAVPPDQRSTVAQADGRAADAAESRLRQAWLTADLPTPFVGFQVRAQGAVGRVSLAHPSRAYAATTAPLPEATVAAWQEGGWWLTRLAAQRVLDAGIEVLAGHLRREFHRQLLAQVEVSPAG